MDTVLFETIEFRSLRKFVQCLYEMCIYEENQEAIGFSLEGDVVEFRDVDLLTTVILPKYFRHNRLPSFIRQLNNYGFKSCAIRDPLLIQSYYHPNFRRGEFKSMQFIQRRPYKEQVCDDNNDDEIDFDMNSRGRQRRSRTESSSSSSSKKMKRFHSETYLFLENEPVYDQFDFPLFLHVFNDETSEVESKQRCFETGEPSWDEFDVNQLMLALD